MDAPFHINNPDAEEGTEDIRSRHSSVLGPYRQHLAVTQFPIYHPIASSSNQASIYCRSMMSKGHGFSPWMVVTSTEPEAHFHQGAGIGDVGYIDDDGGFVYRFNIFHPPNHPIQGFNLPRKFVPIHPPLAEWEIQHSDHFQPGTIIVSEGVDISQISLNPLEIEFSSHAREGSVLVLPQGATREDLVDTDKLHLYIEEHASDWYQYFNGYSDVPLSSPVVNGSLFVVTSSDKAKVWNSALFPPDSDLEKPTVFRYTEKVPKEGRWIQSSAAMTASERDTSSKGKYPCALFLRGLSIALGQAAWSHGVAPIPLSLLPLYYIPSVPVCGRRADLERYVERFRHDPDLDPGRPFEAIFRPAFVFLQILLDVDPSANVAIFEDSVWCPLMNEHSLMLAEFHQLVQRIFDKYEIATTNGVVQFVPENPSELPPKQRFLSYLLFFFKRTARSKNKRQARRKLKKIFSKPPSDHWR